MLAEFVITFRETLEAALVVGIVLAFLSRSKKGEYNVHVYLGIGAGIVASALVGLILASVPSLLGEGAGEQIFEGSIMALAAAFVAWMIIWLRGQKNVAGKIEAHARKHVDANYGLGLAIFIFIAVFREGFETTVFLVSTYFESSTISALGAVLGVAAAVAIGFLMFEFAIKVNLKIFFNASGLLLILFAGGLLVQAVHEFEEAGIVPATQQLWNTESLLSQQSVAGAFFRSLFGYVSQPTLLQLGAYLCFIAAFLYFYFFYAKAGKGAIPAHTHKPF
ncbi:Iron permease FTR1 family protein [Candidatus Anstonella stagnisolia]|nr:Iron permease FTR1 family protein [Candidatus Anstonella stagnisolia]